MILTTTILLGKTAARMSLMIVNDYNLRSESSWSGINSILFPNTKGDPMGWQRAEYMRGIGGKTYFLRLI